jgi:hypothetical protein
MTLHPRYDQPKNKSIFTLIKGQFTMKFRKNKKNRFCAFESSFNPRLLAVVMIIGNRLAFAAK